MRFVTKSSKKGKDGKALRKLKWYGGVVTDIATGGKRVRIKYDDGTSEVADFPDKDIVVDNEGNGQHKHGTNPEVFLPPMPTHPQKSQQQTPSQSEEAKEPQSPADSEKKTDKPSKVRKGDLTLDEIEELRQQKRAAKAAKAKAAAGSAASSGGPAKDENAKQQLKEEKKRRTPTPTPAGNDDEVKPKVAPETGATAPSKAILPPNSPSASSSSSSSSSEVVRRKKKKDEGGKKKRKRSDSPDGVPTTVATKPRKKTSKSAMELALERAAARLEGNKANSPETKKAVMTDKSVEQRPSKETKAEPKKSKDLETKLQKVPVLEVTANKKTSGDDAGVVAVEADTGTANDVEMTEKTLATEQQGTKKRAVSPSAVNAATEPPRKKPAPEDRVSSTGKDNVASEPSPAVPGPVTSENTEGNITDQLAKKAESAADSTDDKTTVQEAAVDEKPAAAADTASIDNAAESSEKKDEKVDQPTPMEVDDAPKSTEADTVEKAVEAPKVTASVPADDEEVSKPAKGDDAEESSKIPPPVAEAPRSKSPGASPKDESKKAKKVALPPVQRSGRRAAQKANELIVAKEERIINEAALKSKGGKKKEDLKIRRSSSKASDDDDDSGEDDDHWAQCEKCQKWRILPASVDKDKLPDPWFCEMNTYDPKRNNCEAPEQTVQEVAKEKKKKAREERRRQKRLAAATAAAAATSAASASPRSPKGTGKSSPVVPDATESKAPTKGASLAPTEDIPPKPSQKKGKRKSPTPADGDATAKPSTEKDVSLSAFEKAKKARQKSGGDASGAAEPKSTSRNRSKPKGGKETEKEKKKATKAKKGKKGKKEESDEEDPDNVEWVQCEKCEKWRKLPPHISAEDLPEVWYCNMNTWDPDSASCGVEEDKMDSSHREFQIMGEGGTFTTSFGSSGKLSYRNLIFGTKGKQNRPLSERQRAADSLFSYQPLDPLGMAAGPPTCLYSTSSAFFHRGASQQKAAAEEASRVSFIDVLSQSRLWDELYRGARAMQSLPIDPANTDAPVSTHVGSMTAEVYVRSMKALIYHAIGTRTLPAHEVLLEAQCRQWDDAQWAELRASCTIDVVMHALNLLAKDGLVQTTTDAATGVLQYKRTNVDGLPKTADNSISGQGKADITGDDKKMEADAKKLESRCMKISKPWKRNKNLALE